MFFRKVGRVARDAAHAVCRVGRTLEVGVLRFQRVTREAALTDDLGRLILERENLGFVSSAVDVLGPWAVARFTAVSFGPLLGFQKAVPVPSLLKAIKEIFVAGFAGIGSHVLRGSRFLIGSRFGRLTIGSGPGARNEQRCDCNPERNPL